MSTPAGRHAGGLTEPERRRVRRILAGLTALVLVGVVAIAGFLVFITRKATNLPTDQSLLPASAGPASAGQASGASGTGTRGPLVGTPGTNYLVIGSDAGAGGSGSSDVILLGHVSEDKKKVYLVHFPRDLYVEIPGRGKDRLNAAYETGGGALLARTIQGLTGVPIDHAAKVDFEGFRRMTDAVGGVRVWADEPTSRNGLTIAQGWNELDGTSALQYVRAGYSLQDGDIAQSRGQLAFVKALMVKTLSPGVVLNPIRLTKFMNALSENIVVDEGLTPGYLRSEALAMRDLRSGDIEFLTAPYAGSGTARSGGAVDLVDEVRMKRLAQALQTDTLDRYLADN